jgi:hypothetical protein
MLVWPFCSLHALWSLPGLRTTLVGVATSTKSDSLATVVERSNDSFGTSWPLDWANESPRRVREMKV